MYKNVIVFSLNEFSILVYLCNENTFDMLSVVQFYSELLVVSDTVRERPFDIYEGDCFLNKYFLSPYFIEEIILTWKMQNINNLTLHFIIIIFFIGIFFLGGKI